MVYDLRNFSLIYGKNKWYGLKLKDLIVEVNNTFKIENIRHAVVSGAV